MRAACLTTALALIAAQGCADDTDDFAPVHTMPALSMSAPADGAIIARTAWVVLTFDTRPEGEIDGGDFQLRCDALDVELEATALRDERVVVNPIAPLPDGSDCVLRWRGPEGLERLSMQVAERGEEASVPYDRDGAAQLLPLPDDVWVREDPTSTTGVRLDIPDLDVPAGVIGVAETLRAGVSDHDGWSPLAAWVVQLDAEPDAATLPHSPAESLDPVSTVALFDLEDGSRVPFYLWNRSETSTDGSPSHVLLIWPAIYLEPGGRYGLVVSNRVLVDVSRPFDASSFMLAALDSPETEQQERAGDLAGEVLAVAGAGEAPFRTDDLALAVRATIGSIDDVISDHTTVWDHVRGADAPEYAITDVVPETDDDGPVAAHVHGTWMAPDWVDDSGLWTRRDSEGRPLAEGVREVPFVIALPKASLDAAAPLIMFQHGQPGNAETQVPCEARTHLAGGGFAVAGFTNYFNREFPNPDGVMLGNLLRTGELPDIGPGGPIYLGEQLAFVRLLQSMGDLDVLPIDAPDGVPDIDASALLYQGQSRGSAQGLPLLAFEPAFVAAVLSVGAGRHWAVNLHQDGGAIYAGLTDAFPDVTLPAYYAGTVLLQMMYDYADQALFAPLVYRTPLELGADGRRASVLMLEGLNDILVPPASIRSTAHALALPVVEPVLATEPFLDTTSGPVSANWGPTTTAGYVQLDPADGPADISYCPPHDPDPADGHQYAQDAPLARALRLHFFQTALTDSAPTIADPAALAR